jgi:hypothetical protein
VYIAGPYITGDPVINSRRAIGVGMNIHEQTGAAVIVPHMSLLAHAMFPRENVKYWYDFDIALLEHCTHLLRLDGESFGADREVKKAEKLDIKIFYGALGENNLIYELNRGTVD